MESCQGQPPNVELKSCPVLLPIGTWQSGWLNNNGVEWDQGKIYKRLQGIGAV